MRLALLVGARVGEIVGYVAGRTRFTSMIRTRAAWLIPAARCKNGRDHMLPLVPLARDTVQELLSLIGPGEEFLFPTRSSRRSGPMRSNSLTQAMDFFSKRVAGTGGAETWSADPPTPHDLRRSLETRLAELRVPKEVRDRVLNHVSSDVGDKHYNLHDYADQKRDALMRWSGALSAVLHGAAANVTPLRSAAP